MSSSAAMSMSRDATGGLTPGAMVPFTQTWINTAGGSTVTTEATLVGQILNNGATNWVGYNNGEAYYLLQTSESGAEQTTLADGQIFYVSSGDPPSGYIATGGAAATGGSGSGAMATASVSASEGGMGGASASASASMASSSNDSSTGSGSGSSNNSGSGSSDQSSSASAAASASASTTPNSSHRLTLSTAAVVACGLLAILAM